MILDLSFPEVFYSEYNIIVFLCGKKSLIEMNDSKVKIDSYSAR